MPEKNALYGFSCVENQLLRFLHGRGWDISRLYADCAIPMKELFYTVVRQGIPYERFENIPRIQTMLAEEGLLAVTMEEGEEALFRTLREAAKAEAVLMMVSSAFAREILLARGLRDDHYVRVSAAEGGFLVENDIPETTAVLTENALREAYAGRILRIRILRDDTREDDDLRWKNRRFRAEDLEPFHFRPEDCDGAGFTARRLRDLTGVYKLTRYRMRAYYGGYVDTSFMDEPLAAAERRYALLEYLHLKKGVGFDRLYKLFTEMNEEEIRLGDRLRTQLDKAAGKLPAGPRGILKWI